MDVEIVIAIHPPFAWLVDWAALAGSGQRWYLVTSAESKERLDREGTSACLAEVVVAPCFDLPTLSHIIRPWLAAPADKVRLATMIEPMQMVVAQLRQRFAIPGASPEEMLPFTDKLAMKASMRGVAAYLPRYLQHDRKAFAQDPHGYTARVVNSLGLPVFAKPTCGNSSVGTAKLNTQTALASFLQDSPDALELDEFVDGEGYHLDSIVVNGRVVWFGAGRYVAPQGQTLYGAPLAGISIGPGDALYSELEQLHSELLGSFAHVPDGCTHMEVLRRPDGRWVFLEVAARVVGVRCPEMHRIARGVDLRQLHYRVLAQQPLDLRERRGPHAGYYCPMKTQPGRVSRLNAPPFVSRHTVEQASHWLERTDVAKTMSMADCLAFYVLWNEQRETIERDLERLKAFRPYELAPL